VRCLDDDEIECPRKHSEETTAKVIMQHFHNYFFLNPGTDVISSKVSAPKMVVKKLAIITKIEKGR
jgi:hypothetical protein